MEFEFCVENNAVTCWQWETAEPVDNGIEKVGVPRLSFDRELGSEEMTEESKRARDDSRGLPAHPGNSSTLPSTSTAASMSIDHRPESSDEEDVVRLSRNTST